MEQLSIKKPIRLIELFAGIGSQAMALRNIGANFENTSFVNGGCRRLHHTKPYILGKIKQITAKAYHKEN